MSTATCNFDAERGWLTPEHVRDCRDHDCRGCKPCPKSHCQLIGTCAHHVERGAGIFTCPSCIGKVRRTLRDVVTLHTLALPAEAAVKGVDSEAFHLGTPAADPVAMLDQREAEEWRRGWCELRPRPELHPYALLGRWDRALREDFGPPTRLPFTVARGADYLDGLLAGDFPHTRAFETFAREIRACRDHAEEVLHNSRKPEEGARCPDCGKGGPRLRKQHGRHAGLEPGQVCATKQRTGACRVCDGDDDIWICPAEPTHRWDEVGYRTRVGATYVKHADELPALELAERLGVSLSTFRKWCAREFLRFEGDEKIYSEPLLKAARRGPDGRKIYRVADAERLLNRERVIA